MFLRKIIRKRKLIENNKQFGLWTLAAQTRCPRVSCGVEDKCWLGGTDGGQQMGSQSCRELQLWRNGHCRGHLSLPRCPALEPVPALGEDHSLKQTPSTVRSPFLLLKPEVPDSGLLASLVLRAQHVARSPPLTGGGAFSFLSEADAVKKQVLPGG